MPPTHTPPQALVAQPDSIRLAMLGMVAGNGHPFSWSAILNGRYDRDAMADCGYPGIFTYLEAQPSSALGIPGAQVTHVWCDDPADTRRVAQAAHIANTLDRPEDAIGQVDAVVIATDIGHEHVERARPFVEAGLPVFVDKPLTDNEDGLRQFNQWISEGRPILSTSCMRYAQEFIELATRLPTLGGVEAITVSMAKSWERYGIHALESVYHLLPPGGWQGVHNTGTPDRNVVHATHTSGAAVVLIVAKELLGAFGHVSVYGRTGRMDAKFTDTFGAFKAQLEAFVRYLRTGERPVPWEQTVEQMKLVIAGLRSREASGRLVTLQEIKA